MATAEIQCDGSMMGLSVFGTFEALGVPQPRNCQAKAQLNGGIKEHFLGQLCIFWKYWMVLKMGQHIQH